MKEMKVMFNQTSGADKNLQYKINELNIANNWNPSTNNPREMGGFNYSVEDKIFRWLVRGDTLYDVEIPKDAEVIEINSESAPHGVFRTNKIILTNPRKVTDEIAMDLYKKSNLPEKSYFKALAGCAIRGHINTCKELIKDRINKDNIKLCLNEIEDFIKPENSNGNGNSNVFKEIMELLTEIDSNLLISIIVDKEPYEKNITKDNIINLTGESGSGKSYYTNKWNNDSNYIVIDTDEVFSRLDKSSGINKELGLYLKNKYKDNIPSLFNDFDLIYDDIINYFKDTDKTIVIDSAQYRNMKNVSNLKGKVIILRTSIDTCYNRCINRYLNNHQNITEEELTKYKNKKINMFTWYKSLNEFIKKVDNI